MLEKYSPTKNMLTLTTYQQRYLIALKKSTYFILKLSSIKFMKWVVGSHRKLTQERKAAQVTHCSLLSHIELALLKKWWSVHCFIEKYRFYRTNQSNCDSNFHCRFDHCINFWLLCFMVIASRFFGAYFVKMHIEIDNRIINFVLLEKRKQIKVTHCKCEYIRRSMISFYRSEIVSSASITWLCIG